ncbi:uncharacterized protein [Panulirus ornatus]|uniref:uncharacterized protein n=1 Tax=Panulirus ornatus TaxID=150431 RepID=UPI003A85A9E9
MLRAIAFLGAALLVAAHPAERILEHDLTVILQEALAPYDPTVIDAVSDLNVVTDHSSFTFNANSVETSGFSKLEVTNFVPPIPYVSHSVAMTLSIPRLAFHTLDYTLVGTHNGQAVTHAGAGDVTMNVFGVQVKFKTESFSLDPISVCVEHGTLTMDLSVDTIDAALEGADEINSDIIADGPALLEGVEQTLNANADNIVNQINNALCVVR